MMSLNSANIKQLQFMWKKIVVLYSKVASLNLIN